MQIRDGDPVNSVDEELPFMMASHIRGFFCPMKADGTTPANSTCKIGFTVSVTDAAGIQLWLTPRMTVVIQKGGCPPDLIRA
eukprot:5901275-Heterocapsa_arctica.AAC.1